MGESDREELRAAYYEVLVKGVEDASSGFDRTVSTLAGGGLVLSIAFVRDIAGPDPVSTGKLAAAWILLGLALIASLGSFVAQEVTHRKALKRLDEAATPTEIDFERLRGQVYIWNIAAGAGVVLGALFLALFAFDNL